MNKNTSAFLRIFDQIVDGVCLTNQGRILYLNPAGEKILGVSLGKVRGSSLCDLLCCHLSTPNGSDCSANCVLRNPDRQEQAVTVEGLYHRQVFGWREPQICKIENSSNLRVRCLKTAPWPDPELPNMHLTVIEDLTGRENLEKEQEIWRSMIAHDLRNPLTIIYSVMRTMQDDTRRRPNAMLIGIGVTNCRRMIKLLDLYLDVSKLDAGRMPVAIQELDFSEIARRCVEDQSPLARERRIAVTVDVPVGLTVMADAELLPRVVENLLDNALKFTPKGGRVELSAGDNGRNCCRRSESVQFSITDTGPGIAPEEIPLLFDRYHQAQSRSKGKTKGTGLGLAFCRQALAVMSGALGVESKLGAGSRFIVRLPASPKRPSAGT